MSVALLLAMPVVHGLGHYLAGGRRGRLWHVVIPFHGCVGSGILDPLSLRRRVGAVAAGLGAHYLAVAAIAMIAYLTWGVPTGEIHTVVVAAEGGSDAARVLAPGDRVLVAGGHDMVMRRGRATPTLTSVVQQADGGPVEMTIQRGDALQRVTVAPMMRTAEGQYVLGIRLRYEIGRTSDLSGSLWQGLAYPALSTRVFLRWLNRAVFGEVEGTLQGPVGITSAIAHEERPQESLLLALDLAVYEGLLFVLVDLVMLGIAVARRRNP